MRTVLFLFYIGKVQRSAVEREVFQFVLVGGLDVEHRVCLYVDVAHNDVITARQRHVGAVAHLVELRPGMDVEEGATLSRDILYEYIFVVLRGVGTHL